MNLGRCFFGEHMFWGHCIYEKGLPWEVHVDGHGVNKVIGSYKDLGRFER
jgi:hypothetical protein